jgi:uncharacterized damage-inducible protein DinB
MTQGTAVAAISPLLEELRQESATTLRVLDRVPADRLTWKPCDNGQTVGKLAFHLAGIPGVISRILTPDTFEPPKGAFVFPEPESKDQIIATFNDGLAAAEQFLSGLTDEQSRALWTSMNEGRAILQMPRAKAIRMLMLNHAVHHRGQLSIYLREMGVPVPSIYGPSGDENPFAQKAKP